MPSVHAVAGMSESATCCRVQEACHIFATKVKSERAA